MTAVTKKNSEIIFLWFTVQDDRRFLICMAEQVQSLCSSAF